MKIWVDSRKELLGELVLSGKIKSKSQVLRLSSLAGIFWKFGLEFYFVGGRLFWFVKEIIRNICRGGEFPCQSKIYSVDISRRSRLINRYLNFSFLPQIVLRLFKGDRTLAPRRPKASTAVPAYVWLARNLLRHGWLLKHRSVDVDHPRTSESWQFAGFIGPVFCILWSHLCPQVVLNGQQCLELAASKEHTRGKPIR